MWATELDTSLSSTICQPSSIDNRPRETVLPTLGNPSCTCHAGYLQVDGSIMSEEFFKAAYYGILKSEQQVIRIKKEFIAWFIYILQTIPDVIFNRTRQL